MSTSFELGLLVSILFSCSIVARIELIFSYTGFKVTMNYVVLPKFVMNEFILEKMTSC